ncbi:MAG: glycosyltransferase family 2 protein [Burkholderiales bacterium]
MIVAVVVTHQPDLERVAVLMSALAPQVSFSVAVDNGSSTDVRGYFQNAFSNTVDVISLVNNLGIAAAQNVGITRAKEKGADYVLLLDQDSVPHHAMVSELITAVEKMRVGGAQVACVGPRYLDDRRQNPPPFNRISGLRLVRGACSAPDSIIPVDYLIASGCLIPISVLEHVGGMREDLFIDYVDIEWGLRARRFGYQSFGVCAAHMAHSLGDQPIRFLGFSFPQHSPLRHYYHCRNAVLLYRERWVPCNWKFVDGWRLCLRYIFYSLFAKPPTAHWRMMTLGLWHGLRGQAGKYGKG